MSSLLSPQGQEVSGHLVQVFARKLHGRHERARLQGCRIVDPGPNILRRVLDHSGADGPPAHQMSQVGPEDAVGGGPRTAWQLMHASDENNSRPACTPASFRAGACCWAAHFAKSSLDWTATMSNIPACWRPQYSAHWPT